MMKNFKRILMGLVVMAGLGFASAASAQDVGGLPAKALNGPVRYRTQLVAPYVINTATVVAPQVAGVAGQVVSQVLTTATSYSVTGSSLGRMPYPAILRYALLDVNTNGTNACTSLVITGVDIGGRQIVYRDATLTETPEYTDRVFSRVDSVVASGCTGVDSSDYLTVVVSIRVGFEYNVAATDVDSICLDNYADGNADRCAAVTGCSTRLLTRDLTRDYVDLSSCTIPGYDFAFRDGDTAMIRLRASTW